MDDVFGTGQPVRTERERAGVRIVRRPGLIVGDPEDLAEIDWSAEWNPDENISPS